MKLLLIRHGETVDNVAGNLAGVTDSALTNHGVLQTERLGKHLAARFSPFAAIFCSDLKRAKQTAQAVLDATQQNQSSPPSRNQPSINSLTVLSILREQDFGSLEGKPWASNRAPGTEVVDARQPGYVPSETKASMDKRANGFIDDYVVPLLVVEPDSTVPVVSHGLLLSRLWKCLLARCSPSNIHLADNLVVGPRGLEHIGAWSNTGVLELDVSLTPASGDPEDGANPVEAAILETELRLDDEARGATKDAVKDLIEPAITHSGPDVGVKAVQETNDKVQLAASRPVLTPAADTARLKITVCAINALAHLATLKRTRGGIGSSAHDTSQGRIDSFFKRQRNN